MLNLTCSLPLMHTMDACVYSFLGQYLVSHYKKDCVYDQRWYVIRQPNIYIYIAISWDLDLLLKHVAAIHIHSCILPFHFPFSVSSPSFTQQWIILNSEFALWKQAKLFLKVSSNNCNYLKTLAKILLAHLCWMFDHESVSGNQSWS